VTLADAVGSDSTAAVAATIPAAPSTPPVAAAIEPAAKTAEPGALPEKIALLR
jgi:hypothetical protein